MPTAGVGGWPAFGRFKHRATASDPKTPQSAAGPRILDYLLGKDRDEQVFGCHRLAIA